MKKQQAFTEEVANTTKTFTTAKGVTCTRQLYKFDVCYSLPTQLIIWNHGKTNYNIWFLNDQYKLCRVKKAEIYKDNIYLTVQINCADKNCKETKMSVDRFLYLYEKGEFKITFKKFVDTYLIPVSKMLK